MPKKIICWLTLIAVFFPLSCWKVKAQEPEYVQENVLQQLNKTKPDIGKPTNIKVGIYLVDFDTIDDKEQSFKLDAYLFLTWKDKRLAYNPKQANTTTKNYLPNQIWFPDIKAINVEGTRETVYSRLTVRPDGTVNYQERFNGKFLTPGDVRSFPFDTQNLNIILEDIGIYENSKHLILSVDKSKVGKSQNAFLTEWDIKDVIARVETKKINIEQHSYDKFIYTITIKRRYQFYVWNILVPLILIIIVSWTVFWSKSYEANVVISFSSLLADIAFNIVVADSLPKISYMTFMDGFILTGYVLICLSIFQIVLKHYLDIQQYKELAVKVDYISRRLFPGLFVGANILLILIFLL